MSPAGNYTEVWPTATSCDSTVHLDLVENEQVTPSISITSNPGSAVNTGQLVTFTATLVYGGTAPVIVWKKNNIDIPGAAGISWQGTADPPFYKR